MMEILHHGAVGGVTGSCHELRVGDRDAILIDCGLFQGAENSGKGANARDLAIEFPLEQVRALVVTHVHIDHVGRIPYLLAAGFGGPIYCSPPSARLLLPVLEDALKIGVTRNRALITRVMRKLEQMIHPVPYGRWQTIGVQGAVPLAIRFHRAGHILGSAWVDCRCGEGKDQRNVIFSGDLGDPDTPLLYPPEQPEGCDLLVMESTYGDRNHAGRAVRQQALEAVLRHALHDRGTVLIPAFSIGRTQELLYELEDILHRNRGAQVADGLPWDDVEIVLDSPMAAKFTDLYRELRPYWDDEAKARVDDGRHPLDFDRLTTVDSHDDHLSLIAYLAKTERPVVVLAASGMCAGGRIVNYLKAMLGNPKHDIVFVGYQARGTPGRAIQEYGPQGGYVELDGERFAIHARVHTLSGYSAHADQDGLLAFVRNMRRPPGQIRLVHGDPQASEMLAGLLRPLVADTRVAGSGG
ncbi:MAG: MBL fold metallo-hydrolase [Chromatiaceae bacterium]|nr:MBL fold metallo-hydrolase [Gammaproteobacteria bacterium]MCP5306944.1 MBL fold metallo-hydrolase [Chromatiaceae bacterium]